jgi:Mlc titration factor MtfA (ptsG expression regulator)
MDTMDTELSDKLDSLHRRMDKFYEWAAILQKEYRDMQQRQKFIESQVAIRIEPAADPIQDRLDRFKNPQI